MLPPATGEGSSTLAILVEIEIPANTSGQYYETQSELHCETQSELLESPTIAVDVIRHLGRIRCVPPNALWSPICLMRLGRTPDGILHPAVTTGYATYRLHDCGIRIGLFLEADVNAKSAHARRLASYGGSPDPPGASEGQEEKDESLGSSDASRATDKDSAIISGSTERSWTSRKIRPPLFLASGLSSSLLERVNGP